MTGTAESGARITAMRTVPSAAGPYTATAGSGGSYTVMARPSPARRQAGNVRAVTVLTQDATR